MSALAWWQLSGVDTLVEDSPRDWLQPAPQGVGAAAAPSPLPDASRSAAVLPQTLEAFRDWLKGSELPFLPSGPRVPPSGSAATGLMLLCGQPEIGEREALFEGAPGQLLDAMLAAIGAGRDTTYIASISPVHLPSRIAPAVAQQLVDVARHHIALAAPRVLLLVGDLAAQLLLGQPVAALRGRSHDINHLRGSVPAVSTFHPRLLLASPARKAQSWQDLRLLLREFGR